MISFCNFIFFIVFIILCKCNWGLLINLLFKLIVNVIVIILFFVSCCCFLRILFLIILEWEEFNNLILEDILFVI